MKLAETKYDNQETGCCARLDEARWEGQEFVWQDKPFVKDHIREFLHLPLNFGSVMARDQKALDKVKENDPQIRYRLILLFSGQTFAELGTGYWLAVAVQSALFPLLGLRVSFSENLVIGAVFTVVSILRSYALRRLFERFRK
mgnify:CR=1 FL=1